MPINQLGVDPFLLRGGSLGGQQRRGGIVGNRPAVPTQESMYAQQQAQQLGQQRTQQFAQSYATREQRRARTAETKERRRQQAAAQAERQQDREAQQQRDMFQAQAQYGLQERRLGAAAAEAEAGREFTTSRDMAQRENQIALLREQQSGRLRELDVIAQDRSLSAEQNAAIQRERDEILNEFQQQDRFLSSDLRMQEGAFARQDTARLGEAALQLAHDRGLSKGETEKLLMLFDMNNDRDAQGNQYARDMAQLGSDLRRRENEESIALNAAVAYDARGDIAGLDKIKDERVAYFGRMAGMDAHLLQIERTNLDHKFTRRMRDAGFENTKYLTLMQSGLNLDAIEHKAGLDGEENRVQFIQDLFRLELSQEHRQEIIQEQGWQAYDSANQAFSHRVKFLAKQDKFKRIAEERSDMQVTLGNIWLDRGFANSMRKLEGANDRGSFNGPDGKKRYASLKADIMKSFSQAIKDPAMIRQYSPQTETMGDLRRRNYENIGGTVFTRPGTLNVVPPRAPTTTGVTSLRDRAFESFEKAMQRYDEEAPREGEEDTREIPDPQKFIDQARRFQEAFDAPSAKTTGKTGAAGDGTAARTGDPFPVLTTRENRPAHAAIRSVFNMAGQEEIRRLVEEAKASGSQGQASFKTQGPDPTDTKRALAEQIAFGGGVENLKIFGGPNGKAMTERDIPGDGEVFIAWEPGRDGRSGRYRVLRGGTPGSMNP